MILWFYALPNNTIPLPLVFFTLRLWRSSGYIIRYFLSPDWKERGKTWPEFSAPLCLLQDSDITAPLKCIENSDLPEDSPCLWSVLDSARDTDHIQTYRVTTGAGHVKLWGMQSPVRPAQHPFPVMDPDTGTSCLPSPTWSVGCQGQHGHSLQWHTRTGNSLKASFFEPTSCRRAMTASCLSVRLHLPALLSFCSASLAFSADCTKLHGVVTESSTAPGTSKRLSWTSFYKEFSPLHLFQLIAGKYQPT